MSNHPEAPRPSSEEARQAADYLRSPRAIRERSGRIFAAGLAGKLNHFAIDEGRLPAVAERIVAVTRRAYPELQVPNHCRWNHFNAGGVPRLALLDQHLAGQDPHERGRSLYDLVVTSVLLDAGAGEAWRYREPGRDDIYTRSEGLAVASFHMFLSGAFADDPRQPYRADARALQNLTSRDLAAHFQADDVDNPLVGVAGRAALLQRLGDAIERHPDIFGAAAPRVGNLFDYLHAQAQAGTLRAATILAAVLDGLSTIWPGRITIAGVNLGDVWRHEAAGGVGQSAGLIPFHKLSQWLTYSLIDPLEQAGVRVTDLDELTGLPEYRNGGLLVDMGVLVPKHDDVTTVAHRPSSEIIVEWRALTIVLLDRVADLVRQTLGVSAEQFPLAKVLEGGTWSAGREVARERREGGGPPIDIDSDGTVF